MRRRDHEAASRPRVIFPAIAITLATLVAVALTAQRASRPPDLLLINGKAFTTDSLHAWARP